MSEQAPQPTDRRGHERDDARDDAPAWHALDAGAVVVVSEVHELLRSRRGRHDVRRSKRAGGGVAGARGAA